MRKWLKQFCCLMITAHSDSIITSGTWEIPTTAECQRCGATISFI